MVINILIRICQCFQNILKLNPKTKSFANLVPSSITKKEKQKWKRNINEKCDVSLTNYNFKVIIIKHFTMLKLFLHEFPILSIIY